MSELVTHRSLTGQWKLCEGEPCGLLFHFPGMTSEEMAEVPLKVLLPLLEPFDPPSHVNEVSGAKEWTAAPRNAAWSQPVLHRDYDLPAVVEPDGTLAWYQDGQLHREADKPAVVKASGAATWYKRGKLHRDGDLPAEVEPDGTRQWWREGKSHRDRENGPALIASPIRAGGSSWQICFMEYGQMVSIAYTASTTPPSAEQLVYGYWR